MRVKKSLRSDCQFEVNTLENNIQSDCPECGSFTYPSQGESREMKN